MPPCFFFVLSALDYRSIYIYMSLYFYIYIALVQVRFSRSLASAADVSLYAMLVRVGWSEEEMLESGLLSLADIEDGKKAAKVAGILYSYALCSRWLH